MSLVDVRVHRRQFGGKQVLRDVSLRIGEGEIVTLVGASGCGKSTLLRIVAGLDTGYEGEVRLRGEPLRALTQEIRFIFQEPRLFPWLTVAQNVGFAWGRVPDAERRAEALLREVGLEGLSAALPKQLSGGQAQRVAIARGLSTRPALLLLDEPFSAVDAFTRMKLQDLLVDLARTRRMTVLMVTHDIDEAVYVSDRVLVMEADPGTLRDDIAIDVPRSQRRERTACAESADRVREALQAAHAF